MFKRDLKEAESGNPEYFAGENEANTVEDYFVTDAGLRKVDRTIVTKPIIRDIGY